MSSSAGANVPASGAGRDYRPDVDGLRGIAILAVVLFHYRLGGVHGGFVGVDVFFVISGFLITRNILADLDAGTWSYARFYTRRARRLFPALFSTLALSFVAAAWLSMPNDFEWFASTAIHSIVSTSNFLFWQSLGYFGPAAERTALLHTWSLSVEEQFYLLWPALILLTLGSRPGGASGARVRRLITILASAGVLSFAAAQLVLETDRQAAFYLMPFRIGEFAAGALVLWIPRLPERWRFGEDVLLGLALAGILICCVWYSQEMRFPGFNALLPAAAAALAIYAGRAPRLGITLGNRPLVWVGLISYSLYLVHWPLLVFTERALLRPLDGWQPVVLLGVAFLLAWLMVAFIERPFRTAPRRARHLAPAAFGLACAGAALALSWSASTVLTSGGWPWRIAEEIRRPLDGLDAARKEREARNRTGTCHLNMWVDESGLDGPVDERCVRFDPDRPNWLILGDSHGADRYSGLSALYKSANLMQITGAGCRPLLDTTYSDYLCRERMDFAFRELLPGQALDGVILAARWERKDLDALRRTIAHLRGLGQRVVVIGPTVELSRWVGELVFHHGRLAGLDDWLAGFEVAERFELDGRVGALSESLGAEYFSAIDAFCPRGRCRFVSGDGKLLIIDYGHHSPEGALVLAQGLRTSGLDLGRWTGSSGDGGQELTSRARRHPAGARAPERSASSELGGAHASLSH